MCLILDALQWIIAMFGVLKVTSCGTFSKLLQLVFMYIVLGSIYFGLIQTEVEALELGKCM